MSDASYSVISYVPDPGRGENLNIGILVWDAESFRLNLDEKAVERVIRENPLLERDALLYVEPLLTRKLSSAVVPVPARINEALQQQRGFPIRLSEPRFTTVADSEDGMDETLRRLTQRIVRPKRRTGGSPPKVADRIAKQLDPLIATHAVTRHHFFGQSKTGVPRQADFFANTGANVALDVVRLVLKKADDIRLRADAEAFRVYDVLEADNVVREYLVLCEFSDEQELEETNHNARTVIEAQGAKVLTDPDEATSALKEAVSA